MSGRVHYLGIRIDGTLTRFFDHLEDSAFEAATALGLPPNWVAWHLEPGESVDNSERARELAKLPIAVWAQGRLAAMKIPESGAIVSPFPLAKGSQELARVIDELA